mgnify:CR=1 FL=1
MWACTLCRAGRIGNGRSPDIAQNASAWHDLYPESVIGAGSFILEGYIDGTEYALDAFFDETGAPHVLNVLRHDFASSEDTSDRLYMTSPSIVRETTSLFTSWLNRVNALVGVRNFPVHVEVRVRTGMCAPSNSILCGSQDSAAPI